LALLCNPEFSSDNNVHGSKLVFLRNGLDDGLRMLVALPILRPAHGSDLGEVTQILVGWPAGREAAALTLVGKEVDFLDANAGLKKQITFSKFITSPLQAVQLDAGVRSRQEQLEADLVNAWSRDPVVAFETKGTREVHGKSRRAN
jgi:hypothetical protein